MKISSFTIIIFLISTLLFDVAQIPIFAVVQDNTIDNPTAANYTVTNSTNATLAAVIVSHQETVRQLKFDTGFEKKINDMINSGERALLLHSMLVLD